MCIQIIYQVQTPKATASNDPDGVLDVMRNPLRMKQKALTQFWFSYSEECIFSSLSSDSTALMVWFYLFSGELVVNTLKQTFK